MDRVKTFEDACKVLGIQGDIFSGILNDALADDCQAITDHMKLIIITRALNEGWKPNWDNSNEHKYYPWFDMKKGFVLNNVNYNYLNSNVSSRLCFEKRDVAKYAAKQFFDLYKNYFTIN